MNPKRSWIAPAVLLIIAIAIKVYSNDATRVEQGYATGFYPAIASFFRLLFGWLPFSIGDILYGLAGAWLVWRLVRGIRAIIKKQVTKASFAKGLRKLLLIILSVYIIFNLCWGINYQRQGIAAQMDIKVDTFSYAELKDITIQLAGKLNATKSYLLRNNISYPSNNELFRKIRSAYTRAADSLPFLRYKNISIKPSIWSWVGNYTGFTGYYNPFTGEAQVNTLVPKFLQPFVACHEVAHQVGYAKENEASSVGYLSALYSGDSLLLYSTYFDLYTSARRELVYNVMENKDTASLKEISAILMPEVKDDIREMLAFFNRHKNPVGPLVREGYAFYLKNNNQPGGMHSYDEVTAFLIAYYRKYKRF